MRLPCPTRLCAAGALVLLLGAVPVAAEERLVTSHGVSTFDELDYPADFPHFDYVNPDAPKGGIHHTWSLGSFDSLTPFTEKGNAAAGAWDVFDSLMTGSLDTLDQMYGLIAESATWPEDKRWISFRMRPEARFSDGSPLTAEDVVFTFDKMQTEGQVRYRAYFGGIDTVEALGEHEVKFTFAEDAAVRDLLPIVAGTAIFSKAYFEGRNFAESSIDPPLGSGPYQVERVVPGRTVVYRRDPDYWARDLPVNVGKHNFDRIRIDYYTDQSSAFEAFKAGEYTFRGETNADRWMTGYDFPAMARGHVVRAEVPARTVPSAGGLYFNLRRAPFDDPLVRQAVETMFNFEWINATLFHGVEARAASFWERSAMRAEGPPPQEEREIIEALLPDLPAGLADLATAEAVMPTIGAGAQRDRGRQRQAIALLEAAGYALRDGRMIGPDGRQLGLEMMYASPDAEQYLSPFSRMLAQIGIDARLRLVDSAQWRERVETFDFDAVHVFVPMSDTPGAELNDAFGSEFAMIGGSLNVGGVASPAIDRLIGMIETAESRDALEVRVRVLDRVLRAMQIRVPYWVRPEAWIAHYDYYRHPDPLPDYGIGVTTIWWADPERHEALRAAGALR